MSRYRTPLRYPGGKQRLAPFILELLSENGLVGGHYVEPYAGGAGVALELLLDNIVSHIHINDSSIQIYSFWEAVLSHTENLCRLISRASLDIDEWKRRREVVRFPERYDVLEVGFSTFYLNRCNRSGVLSGGVIGGLDQTGKWKMDARFSRNDLIRRIEAVASRRDAISLSNQDAEDYIHSYIPMLPEFTLVYCDPPYFDKSSGLYLNRYKRQDHARLAETIQGELRRKWVVSYDNCDEIASCYSSRRSFVYDLQYNASRVYKGREVFIFSDDLFIPHHSSLPFINDGLSKLRELNIQERVQSNA